MLNENLIYGITDNSQLNIKKEILLDTPFVNFSYEERINPKVTMPNCKNIIVVGMGYTININKDTSKPYVASGYLAFDYHKILNMKLKKLVTLLENSYTLESKIFVDTGPLVERELAYKAGLGFYGKNHSIISKKFGSAFFIGYIMTDVELPISSPVTNNCGTCKNCIEVCPAKILTGTKEKLDFKSCCSYLTQKKEHLSENEKNLLSNKLYGCDDCIYACPFNNAQIKFENNTLDFKTVTSLSNREFKEKFKDTGIFWRGNSTIKRNAQVGMYNSKK